MGCVAGRCLRGGGGNRRCCNDPPADGGGGGGWGGRPGWNSVHGGLGGGEEVRRYADDAPEGGAGGAAASPAELGNVTRCSAPGAAAAGGVRVDQHSLVCAAICINQRNKGGQCEPRGDGDGDVGDTIGRPGENFVLAPENTRNAAELAKMLSDDGVRQRGGGAGETNGEQP